MVRRPAKKKRKSVAAKQRRDRSVFYRAKQAFFVLFALVSLACAGLVGTYLYFGHGLPDYKSLEDYQPPQITRVFARDGSVIGSFHTERRTLIGRADIPDVLVQAILSAEDADFYSHEGLDYMGMARAAYNSIRAGRVTGSGSTITQQTVKNLLLTPARTVRRKVRELILAKRLEQHLTKDDILTIYLNAIYLGHGRHGVQEAARYYFGCDASALDLNQSATLAGLIQSPERISPFKHPERAKQRRRYVLNQMKRNGYITEDIVLSTDKLEFGLRDRRISSRNEFGWVVDEVYKRLKQTLPTELIKSGGLQIHTTIDPIRQRSAIAALKDGLTKLDKRQKFGRPVGHISKKRLKRWRAKQTKKYANKRLKAGTTLLGRVQAMSAEKLTIDFGFTRTPIPTKRLERRYGGELSSTLKVGDLLNFKLAQTKNAADTKVKLRDAELPEGAILVVDNRTRGILAMVGGWDYQSSKFNRALHAKRQPGSAFKPFVWGAAIDSKKFTPASMLIDAPETLRLYQGRYWQPKNYTRKFKGQINLREALAQSVNSISVNLAESVGVDAVHRFASQAGIRSKLNTGLSMSLGSSELTMQELTNAYATIASAGMRKPSRLIDRVMRQGSDMWKAAPQPEDTINPAVAFIVRDLMRTVVTDGSGSGLKGFVRPVVGKTGTTNAARDTWFVGSLPDTSFAAWVGFDNGRSLGKKESGGRTAVPIVRAYLEKAESNGADWKPWPEEITAVDIVTDGRLAPEGAEESRREFFLAGTEPTEVAPAAGEQDERGFLSAHELPPEAGNLKIDPVEGAPTEIQDDPGDTPELSPLGARLGGEVELDLSPIASKDEAQKGAATPIKVETPTDDPEDRPAVEEKSQPDDEPDDEDKPR